MNYLTLNPKYVTITNIKWFDEYPKNILKIQQLLPFSNNSFLEFFPAFKGLRNAKTC